MTVSQIDFFEYFFICYPFFLFLTKMYYSFVALRRVGKTFDDVFELVESLKFTLQSFTLQATIDKPHFLFIFVLVDFFH